MAQAWAKVKYTAFSIINYIADADNRGEKQELIADVMGNGEKRKLY